MENCHDQNISKDEGKYFQSLKNDDCNMIWNSIEDISAINLDPLDLEKGPNCSRLRDDENYDGFDNNVGATWIYPINKPTRNYQLNISKAALFHNTLVVLPTGLGKTFIAAVVMYNIYRWYPKGKIIFMAPTRPLVTQQIEACCTIMGIPKLDIAEMTGKTNKVTRREEWRIKRLFFATPQVVQIDLIDPELDFPFKNIKLVVVDEAHKAKGKFAYVDVIQSLHEKNKNFRVLALSATPGRNIVDVVEIIRNLLISKIEIRYENSLDVVPYIHSKNIKTIAIPLGDELASIRDELIDLIDPYFRTLIEEEVISGNISNMSKGWLIMEQKKFRERSLRQRHINHSKVSTHFSICISLYHALELLERHGIRVLTNYFDDDKSEKEKFFVNADFKIKKFVEKLRQRNGKNPLAYSDNPMSNGRIPDMPDDLDFGHPKFEKARDVILEHFRSKPESRSIIFCEFRESVMLMHRILLQNRPIIRPKCFVGQGGTGSIRAVTQAHQLKVMREFREGTCNTLIATSVAEEGIDVGEVDLIICFDISTKNPIRLIQRVGRTGRIRQGQVIMLATEGKEHSIIKEVLANKDKTNLKLIKSREIKEVLYKRSPRLVPPEFDPKCVEVFMKASSIKENTIQNLTKKIAKQTKKNESKKNRSKNELSQNNDVRNYFKKIQPEFTEEEQEIFDLPEIDEKKVLSKIQEEIFCADNFSTDYVVTQFENTEYENGIQNTSTVKELESRYKKLNHMARHLDKDSKFVDYSKSIDELLKSKTINKFVKKYILIKNGDYIREKHEAMKIISTVDSEICGRNYEIIENGEKKIREIYKLIKDVLGDEIEIEYFVKNFEEKKCKKELLNNFKKKIAKDIDYSFRELEKRKPNESLNDIFNANFNKINVDQFCSIDVLNILNNSNKSSAKLLDEEEMGASFSMNAIEDELENSECDSKYASQWTQFNNLNIIRQSTPKHINYCMEKEKKVGELKSRCVHSLNFRNVSVSNERKEFSLDDNDIQLAKKTSVPTASYKDEPKFIQKCDYVKNVQTQSQILLSNSLKKGLFEEIDSFLNDENKFSKKVFCDKKTTYEVSADLFDEDFDLALIESENIIKKQLEMSHLQEVKLNKISTSKQICDQKNRSSSRANCETPKRGIVDSAQLKCVAKNLIVNKYENFVETKEELPEEQSMMSISQILEVVAQKESSCMNKINLTNPELEDFDINDFVEPFEEEEQCISSPEISKNISASDSVPDGKVLETLNNKISSQATPTPADKDGQNAKKSFIKNLNMIDENKTNNHIKECSKTSAAGVKMLLSPKQNTKIKVQKFEEISPSLIRRTTSRLKLKDACEYSNFSKCISDLSSNQLNKTNNILNFESAPSAKDHNNKSLINESTLLIKPVKKVGRVLYSSDSETESGALRNSSGSSHSNNAEVVATPTSKFQSIKNRQRLRAERRRRLKCCHFIEDEAGHSSSDSKNDDEICDLTDVYDSIVVRDDEAENYIDTDMYHKYIQTTKSPQRSRNGGFKIPAPRQYNDMSKIFSQPIEEKDDTLDCYKGSFVVSDEEYIDSEENGISPLSKAEAILRKRKRDKRKKQSVISKFIKRRRILNNIVEISDDDDG